MNSIKNIKEIIKQLVAIGERQLEGEKEARKVIENFLEKQKVDFAVQEYITEIPRYIDWDLKIDNKKIESLPCGLKSGKITNNYNLLSSLISSQKNFYDTNINFNPLCEYISRSNHYMAPALAINRKDVQKVIDAKKIDGFIKVKKNKHLSGNILVGNLKNPKNIIFSHYDSISSGAIDNASGVAVSLNIITKNKHILEDNLFVIAGNEELSYDKTVYWGHGYRVFQKKYSQVLNQIKNIFILDCLGYAPLEIITNSNEIKFGFPIKNMDKFLNKIKFLSGDYDELMKFYHAENDTLENISARYLKESQDEILKNINS